MTPQLCFKVSLLLSCGCAFIVACLTKSQSEHFIQDLKKIMCVYTAVNGETKAYTPSFGCAWNLYVTTTFSTAIPNEGFAPVAQPTAWVSTLIYSKITNKADLFFQLLLSKI